VNIHEKKFHTGDRVFCAVMTGCLMAGLLFFASLITSTDDEQLFASAAQSLAARGEFTALQMWGNERVMGWYSMIAPLHVLIGSLAYRLADWLQVGRLQILYVLSPAYTTLTAYLLMQMALRRGYSRKTAALAGLVFVFTTIAFPFSKTFFREPLAMLLLTLAFYFVDVVIHAHRSLRHNLVSLFLALTFFLLAVWTKEFLAACLPFFAWLVMCNRQVLFAAGKENQRQVLQWAGAALLVLMVVLVIWLLQDRSGRFSISYFKRLVGYLPIMPHTHFLPALLGMFFSASKGFFFYSPILISGLLLPLTKTGKENRQDWIFAAGCTLGVAAVQAFAYDANWFTFTWSTRFLLPLIPFWMLTILPCLDRLWGEGKAGWKISIIALIVMGIIFQLGAVLTSDANYTEFLWQEFQVLIEGLQVPSWEALPAVGHWLALAKGVRIDVGWVRGTQAQVNSILKAPIACALLVVVGVIILTRKKEVPKVLEVIFLILCLALPLWVVNAHRVDPFYSSSRFAYQQALQYLQEKTSTDETILVEGYNHPYWYFYFNFSPLPNEWIGLPAGVRTSQGYMLYPNLQDTVQLINERHPTGERVWLVSEKDNAVHRLMTADVLASNGWQLIESRTFMGEGETYTVSVTTLLKK